MSFKGKICQGRAAVLTAAVLACLSSPYAYASEDIPEEDTSNVSTKDIHVEADFDKEMLKEAPETKTIISRADLDRKGARTLSDALAAEQDIQMGTDNMGRKTVGIRGAEPRHTLILVDGRRLAGGLSNIMVRQMKSTASDSMTLITSRSSAVLVQHAMARMPSAASSTSSQRSRTNGGFVSQPRARGSMRAAASTTTVLATRPAILAAAPIWTSPMAGARLRRIFTIRTARPCSTTASVIR